MRTIKAIWYPSTLTLLFTCLSLYLIPGSVVAALISAALAFGFSLDTFGRHYEYAYLRNNYKKEHGIRYWVMFQQTRCAREVMSAIDSDARKFYYNKGYRWYHFIPDNFSSKVRSLHFWKTVFGIRKFP